MSNYLKEAFKELELLEESAFDLRDDEDIEKLGQQLDDDSLNGIEMVIDVNADVEDDLEDSYVGKVLLWCPICHALHYADKDSLVKEETDEEIEDDEMNDVQEKEELVNIDEICPECHEKGQGFVVKGEVAPYEEYKIEKEVEEKEVKDDDIDLSEFDLEDEEEIKEESLKESFTKESNKYNNTSLVEELISGDLSRSDFDKLGEFYEVKGIDDTLEESKCEEKVSKRDDIDAKKDNKKELAKKKYQKAVDDADADRDDEVKKLEESYKKLQEGLISDKDWEKTIRAYLSRGFDDLRYLVGEDVANDVEELSDEEFDKLVKYVIKNIQVDEEVWNAIAESISYWVDQYINNGLDESCNGKKCKKLKESQEDYYVLSDGKNPRKSRVFDKIEVDEFIDRLEKNKEGKPYHELIHYVKGEPIRIWTSEKGKIEESISNPRNVILVKIDDEWKTWGGTNADSIEKDSRYGELIKKYGKENLKFVSNKDLDKAKLEESSLIEEPVYDLSPRYDSRQSFYGKARVEVRPDGSQILWSYSTPVVFISKDGQEAKLLTRGYYGWSSSQTTLRHVKDFLQQNGFEAGSSKDLAKKYEVVDYYELDKVKEESLKESKELKEGTSNFGRLEHFPLLTFDDFESFYEYVCDDEDCPVYDDYDDEEKWYEARDEFFDKAAEKYGYPLIEVSELRKDIEDFNNDTYDRANDLYDNEDNEDDYYNLKDVKLVIKPGYYEAAYIDVDAEEDLDGLSEKVKEEQLKRFSDFFKEMKNKYGLLELRRLGTFSNGESVYTKVDESLLEAKDETEKIVKFIDKAVKSLKEDGSFTHYMPLGEKGLCLVVGSVDSAAYGNTEEELKDYELDENGDVICCKIAINIDDLQADYDIDWYMPSEKDGEVYDTEVSLMKDDSYEHLAQTMLNEYNMLKEYDFDDDAVIIEDEEVEEFDESLFDNLINKYCKRVYENVDSYKTTKGSIIGNNLIVEGRINYKSGKFVSTKFIFEKLNTKDGIIKFKGLNETFSNSKKAFTIQARLENKKLMSESLSYSYKVKVDEELKSLYDKVRNKK